SFFWRAIGNLETVRERDAIGRQRNRQRRRLDARKRPNMRQHLPPVREELRLFAIPTSRRGELQRQQSFGGCLEARLHASEQHKAANQQPCAREQHDRQRDFRDDERGAQAAPAWRVTAARSLLEPLGGAGSGRTKSRYETERHPAQDRDEQRKEQDSTVGGDFIDAPPTRRRERPED